MAYKKFIRRGGKIFGPYYYESYRDEKGVVKKKYLGTVDPDEGKKRSSSHRKFLSFFHSARKKVISTKIEGLKKVLLIPLIVLLALGLGLVIFNQTDSEIAEDSFGNVEDFFSKSFVKIAGFVVSDTEGSDENSELGSQNSDEIEDSEEDGGDSVEEVEEEEEEVESSENSDFGAQDLEEEEEDLELEGDEAVESFGEDSEEVKEVGEVANESVEETREVGESNETIVDAPIGHDPAGLDNETVVSENEMVVDDIIVNETVELNETAGNETLELNETLSNETIIEENETVFEEIVVNETEVAGAVESLTTLQYKAVIHRPVKWLKKVNVSIAENLTIEIPRFAENVSVLTDGEIEEAEQEIEDYEGLVGEADKEEIVSGFLTGDVVKDIDSGKGFLSRLWDWISSFTISGNVVLEDELEADGEIVEAGESKIVDVEKIVKKTGAKEVAVEYYTPAPVVVEQNFSGGKLVTISADDVYNYPDVLAYSLVGGMGIHVNNSVGLKVYWRASYEDAVRYGYVEDVDKKDLKREEKEKAPKEKDSDEKEKKVPSVDDEVNDSEIVEEVPLGEGGNVSDGNESLVDEVEESYEKDKKVKDKENKSVGNGKKLLITGRFASVVEAGGLELGTKNSELRTEEGGTRAESLEYVRVEINCSVHDLDGDGVVDYVEWIVPHLSNQSYEISLEILNVQSYPTVGGNWSVGFNTTGTANLTVSAFNGTTYGFDYFNESIVYDLEFLELKCGDEVLNVSVIVNGSAVPYEVYLKKKRIEEIRRLL